MNLKLKIEKILGKNRNKLNDLSLLEGPINKRNIDRRGLIYTENNSYLDELKASHISYEEDIRWGIEYSHKWCNHSIICGGWNGDSVEYALGLSIDPKGADFWQIDKELSENFEMKGGYPLRFKDVKHYIVDIQFDLDNYGFGRYCSSIYVIAKDKNVIKQIVDYLKEYFYDIRLLNESKYIEVCKYSRAPEDKDYIYVDGRFVSKWP